MKFIVMYNTWQLVLYSNKLLQYYDPKNNKLKGQIVLDNTCRIHESDYNEFILNRPEWEYTFKTIDTPASKWVEEISKLIN